MIKYVLIAFFLLVSLQEIANYWNADECLYWGKDYWLCSDFDLVKFGNKQCLLLNNKDFIYCP